MGINMDVDHVAFSSLDKFDGFGVRPLRPEELGQIAGRAGRHMNDGTFGVTAEADPLADELVARIESHRYDPVRVLQWRNSALDFRSLDSLLGSRDRQATMSRFVICRSMIGFGLSLRTATASTDCGKRVSCPIFASSPPTNTSISCARFICI
jgi:ATP-dependent RNA helicase SUPV3L1/SUV3